MINHEIRAIITAIEGREDPLLRADQARLQADQARFRVERLEAGFRKRGA